MKLCVMMLDRHRTRMALIHENNYVPYGRRYVEVPLTPEQIALLTGRTVGFVEVGQPVREEIGELWLEREE